MSIEGRKLLITGGTGALGRAVAAMALERGAAVAASYLLPAECTAAEVRNRMTRARASGVTQAP